MRLSCWRECFWFEWNTTLAFDDGLYPKRIVCCKHMYVGQFNCYPPKCAHAFNECYKCSDTQNCLNTFFVKRCVEHNDSCLIAEALTSMYKHLIGTKQQTHTHWQAQHFKCLCFLNSLLCGLVYSIVCFVPNSSPQSFVRMIVFSIEQPYRTIYIDTDTDTSLNLVDAFY